jgi:hypothetical protein
MKTAKITIAGNEYTIKELSIRKSVEWRKRVATEWSELANALTTAGGTSLNDLSTIATAVQGVASKIFGSIEVVADLLFAYSPELAADRDRIEAEGFESEIIDAFVEVLALAFPFSGKLRNLMREIGSQKP